MFYEKELNCLKKHIKTIYKDARKVDFKSSFKGVQDIVTTTDLAIEKAIVQCVRASFPNDHFHTEEFYNDTELKDRTWVIDPIDGTSNYAAHMDLFVIQIALFDQGDIVLSYVYVPGFDKTYYALKGQGAYLNGVLYAVSDHLQSSNMMISMVGATLKNNDKFYYHYLLKWAQSNQYKLRMLGSIGLEMCFTSEGIFDVYYSNVRNIWDIYPGLLLLREAGALICNELGEPYRLNIDSHMFVFKTKAVKNLFFKSLE